MDNWHVERRNGPDAAVPWRTALASECVGRGWRDQSRFEAPVTDVAVSCIDFVPESSGWVETEGPATFCIATFLDGQGRLATHGGLPLDIEPGTTVVFASSAPIRGANYAVAGHRVHIVDFRYSQDLLTSLGGVPADLLQQSLLIDRSAPVTNALMVGFRTPSPLLAVAKSVADCRIAPDGTRALYMRAKALEMLALTIDALARATSGNRALAVGDRRKVEAARRLLEERFDETWTIPRLARAVALNQHKLKLGFRTLVGRSVRAYLRTLRIDAAATMLEDGGRVTDVAAAVGFDNLSHFSKVFRELKGTLPSAYTRAAATPADSP